jgi:hypothetical protein
MLSFVLAETLLPWRRLFVEVRSRTDHMRSYIRLENLSGMGK